MKDRKQSPLINDQIRASRMQLITHEGKNIGEVSRNEALQIADDANLDLVIISDLGPGKVPVAKIMDYGKVLYEKKKKQVDAKKHQAKVQIKEIKIRPKIGEHDYQTKIRRAIEFLKSGKRVKVSLFFRGRENINKEQRGRELFKKVDQTLQEQGLHNVVKERETSIGQCWFRIYFLKQ